ncbi:MAG: 4Fe-4S binding protein [Phascolarctobacterium faecium]
MPQTGFGNQRDRKVEVVAEDKCIQCGQCETRCPDFAIFVEK